MEYTPDVSDDILQLIRLGLSGRPQDIQAYARRLAKRLQQRDSDLADKIVQLVARPPSIAAPLRDAGGIEAPIDIESRLQLARHEAVVALDQEPIHGNKVKASLQQVILEQENYATLAKNDLTPSRTLLFVGPPGVGKTMSSRWIARELGRALITLDLSSVMSSFLGRTGANIKHVLEYAKQTNAILLLDDFDAIAKRRDDVTEVGELKRLVAVLLQEIDDWPPERLMIAATNHPELLDPAVWRRFDLVIDFEMPGEDGVRALAEKELPQLRNTAPDLLEAVITVLTDKSFSDAHRTIRQIKRRNALMLESLAESTAEVIKASLNGAPIEARKAIASSLRSEGIPERRVHEITGLARETIRKVKVNAKPAAKGKAGNGKKLSDRIRRTPR